MFGIIYTLLGLGAYGKGLIKQGAHDAKNTAAAIGSGKNWYTDFKGRSRLVNTNEHIMFCTVDYINGDRGYEIIDPKSQRKGQTFNLTEQKRQAEWQEANARFKNGKLNYRFGKLTTVIEGEPSGTRADEERNLDPERDQKYINRFCEGFRLRDIETGKMLVERNLYVDGERVPDHFLSLNDANEERKKHGGSAYFVYMDAETGMLVRGSDLYINNQNLKQDGVDDFIKAFNMKQADDLANGLKEADPKRYFRNKSDWIDPRRRVRYDW